MIYISNDNSYKCNYKLACPLGHLALENTRKCKKNAYVCSIGDDDDCCKDKDTSGMGKTQISGIFWWENLKKPNLWRGEKNLGDFTNTYQTLLISVYPQVTSLQKVKENTKNLKEHVIMGCNR